MLYPRSAICVLVGAMLAASGAYAQSQTSAPQTSIGVLTCTSGAGIEGKGAADNPDLMTCGFKPTERRRGAALFRHVQDSRSGREGADRQARVGVVGAGPQHVEGDGQCAGAEICCRRTLSARWRDGSDRRIE